MTSAPPPFTSFLDAIDGTLCLPAGARPVDVAEQIGPHALRFPLLLDPEATLEEQITATTHAPASSRFGPFCDNVLGMNWQLPDGRVLRVGERVVKTTTGYDWLRFLLHTGRRFGRPMDYVLRLRPDCGGTTTFLLNGVAERVERAARRLLADSWMHWLDAVDVLAQGETRTLRVVVHCPSEERALFKNHLHRVAADHELLLESSPLAVPPMDGLPDAVFKATPDRVFPMATELVRSHAGVRCVVLCYSGVVHAWMPEGESSVALLAELARPHLPTLRELGGDWHSRHLPARTPSAAESAWLERLQTAFPAS
jgi:hypothetical protein